MFLEKKSYIYNIIFLFTTTVWRTSAGDRSSLRVNASPRVKRGSKKRVTTAMGKKKIQAKRINWKRRRRKIKLTICRISNNSNAKVLVIIFP